MMGGPPQNIDFNVSQNKNQPAFPVNQFPNPAPANPAGNNPNPGQPQNLVKKKFKNDPLLEF